MSNSPSPGSLRRLTTSSSWSSMFSYWPSESSTQPSRSSGILRRSSGLMPSLPMCQVSITTPVFVDPVHHLERGLDAVHVDVERHELVEHLRRAVLRAASAHQLGVGLLQARHLARRARDVAGLDVMRVERGRRPRTASGACASAALRASSPSSRNQSQMNSSSKQRRPLSSSTRLMSSRRALLELVLDVGVPEAQSDEPRLGRLGAALGEVDTSSIRGRSGPPPGPPRSSTRLASSTLMTAPSR